MTSLYLCRSNILTAVRWQNTVKTGLCAFVQKYVADYRQQCAITARFSQTIAAVLLYFSNHNQMSGIIHCASTKQAIWVFCNKFDSCWPTSLTFSPLQSEILCWKFCSTKVETVRHENRKINIDQTMCNSWITRMSHHTSCCISVTFVTIYRC